MKTVGKIILFGGIAVAAVVIGLIVTLAAMNPGNIAETSETPADAAAPATRHYYISKIRVETNPYIKEEQKSVLIRDIESLLTEQKTYLQSWRVVETKAEKDSAIIKAEVPVVFFTDDLEVRLQYLPSKDEKSQLIELVVNVRSASRVGKSDLGENRRHIEQLLEAMDFRFGDDKL